MSTSPPASLPVTINLEDIECSDSLPDFETAYDFHRYIFEHRGLVIVNIGRNRQATEKHSQWMVKGNLDGLAARFRTVEAITCAARMAHHMDGNCCGLHKELLQCAVVGGYTLERHSSPI